MRLLFICICLYIFNETIVSECSTFHMAPHMYGFSRTRTGLRHGPWHSLVLCLGWTTGDQWVVDSAIGTGFYKLLSVFAKSCPPHMPQYYMKTIGNLRNNSKIAPNSFNLVRYPLGKPLALVASRYFSRRRHASWRHGIPSRFNIITSMTASFVSLCSPTGRVMGREQV